MSLSEFSHLSMADLDDRIAWSELALATGAHMLSGSERDEVRAKIARMGEEMEAKALGCAVYEMEARALGRAVFRKTLAAT